MTFGSAHAKLSCSARVGTFYRLQSETAKSPRERGSSYRTCARFGKKSLPISARGPTWFPNHHRRFQKSKANREVVDDFQNYKSVLKLTQNPYRFDRRSLKMISRVMIYRPGSVIRCFVARFGLGVVKTRHPCPESFF